MAEKTIRSLSKIELLDILHQQETEIERLNAEKDILLQRLDERTFDIQKAGSLAEASLKLSGVMTAAQEAADIYLENVKALETKQTAIISDIESEVREKTQVIFENAIRKRAAAEAGAKIIADELNKLFDFQFERLTSLRSEFNELVDKLNIMEEHTSELPVGAEAGTEQ